MKKILVLGASGFIGRAICNKLGPDYEVFGTYYSNKVKLDNTMMVKLDISKDDMINNVLATVEPDIVISTLRGDFVYQIRAHENLAKYLSDHGGRLIYLSTANVYDALTNKPHVESEPTGSNSDYGKFKITCENLLHEKMGPLATILRLPIVFGKESKRVTDIVSGLKRGAPLLIYRDYYISLHSDVLLAKQIEYLLEHDVEGILHLGSHDVIGYVEAMALLTKQLGYEGTPLRYERIQDQPYYLALTTERNALPVDLLFSSEQIIESL